MSIGTIEKDFIDSISTEIELVPDGRDRIFSLGLTPMLMVFMFFVGFFIVSMMSFGSFIQFCGRLLSCFIICILFLLLVFAYV